MKRAYIPILVFLLLAACSTVRTDVVKPALDEEVAWSKMFQQWSAKAYASRDFRAGFLQASTKPWTSQMPMVLSQVITDIAATADPKSQEYKEGVFGGLTLSYYGVLTGQGTRWLVEQLFNLGLIPGSIVSTLFGG